MRIRLGIAVTAVTMLLVCASAQADPNSLSLSVSPAQPTDASGVQITASGGTADSSHTYFVYVHYQAAGGSCASNPDDNPPVNPDSSQVPSSGTSFSISGDPQQVQVGSYLVCGWLIDNDAGQTVAIASIPLTVNSADSVSLSESVTPVQGRKFDLDASGVSYDKSSVLYGTYKPAGGACATNPLNDPGTALNGNGIATGTGQYSTALGAGVFLPPGTYLVCGWLIDQADTSVVLATTQQVLTVPALHAVMRIEMPAKAAQGSAYTLKLGVELDYGVPVLAIVDLLPKRTFHGCPGTPEALPRADQPINDDLLNNQQPTGTVSTSMNEGVNGSVVACAWLEDQWSNADHPPVVAGPVSATLTAVGNETFRGHTSQHRTMSIGASPFAAKIVYVQYRARVHCDGVPRLASGGRWNGLEKGLFNYLTFGLPRPDKSGRFAIKLPKNPNHTFTLHGRVIGRHMSGTFTETGRSWVFTHNQSQNLRCTTGRVSFSLDTAG